MLNLRYESGLYCLMVSLLCLCASAQDVGSSARVASVKVATAAPSATNRALTIWYRVPAGYSAQQAVPSRILVIFGGRNASGKEEVSGKLGWDRWADAQNAFLVSPGYYNDDYWEPRAWSGKALLDGIDLIRKRYLVCDRKLLYYGYSAGSQCANLFAAWRPDFARGWVAHGCGVFHEPKLTLRQVPGLVTCGDADTARFIISRKFVERCRQLRLPVLWKSFPNSPHDVPPDSLKLARAWLEYCDALSAADLTGKVFGNSVTLSAPPAFIGDDVDNVYYPPGSAGAANIFPQDAVILPTVSVAEAWGKPCKTGP